MHRFEYDKEFAEALGLTSKGPMSPNFTTPHEIRKYTQDLLEARAGGEDQGVEQRQFTVKSFDGADITITQFIPPRPADGSANGPTPAVVYLHGGGMVAGKVQHFAPSIITYAKASGLPFFGVEYRLAPEHPAPAAIEDAYACVQHLIAHGKKEFNVDPARIALLGLSAGGGIAASVALVARERRLSPPIALQMLVSPMLDDRSEGPGDDTPGGKLMIWKAAWNKLGWDAYLGKGADGRGARDPDPAALRAFAVPGRVDDLAGLPSAYLEIGTVDLFLEETVRYGTALSRDGVQVEMHVWPGLPHGWEAASSISWFKTAADSRLAALKRLGQ